MFNVGEIKRRMVMISALSANDESRSYYSKMYKDAQVDSQNKVSYTVRKGDNLWNLALRQFDGKKVSNSDVMDMMYKIAKLNNKDSIEKANDIKINDKIFLPKDTSTKVNDKVTETVQKAPQERLNASTAEINKILYEGKTGLTYSEKSLLKSRNSANIPDDLYSEHGKAGIAKWSELLIDTKDNTIDLEKSYTYMSRPTGLVVRKRSNKEYNAPLESLLYINTDGKGNVTNVTFNSFGVNIYSTHLDYSLDADGSLYRKEPFGKGRKLEKLPKEEYEKLFQLAQKYVDENIK